MLFYMPHSGLWNVQKLFKSAGSCLLHSVIKGRATNKERLEWVPPPVLILCGWQAGRTAGFYWHYWARWHVTSQCCDEGANSDKAFLLCWGSSAMLAMVIFLYLCPEGKDINSCNLFTVLHDRSLGLNSLSSWLCRCFDMHLAQKSMWDHLSTNSQETLFYIIYDLSSLRYDIFQHFFRKLIDSYPWYSYAKKNRAKSSESTSEFLSYCSLW